MLSCADGVSITKTSPSCTAQSVYCTVYHYCTTPACLVFASGFLRLLYFWAFFCWSGGTGGASTQIIFRHDKGQPDQVECDSAAGVAERVWEGGGGATSDPPSSVSEEALGRRGGVDTVPVSQDDFWGVSHLGYGVAEVRERLVLRQS